MSDQNKLDISTLMQVVESSRQKDPSYISHFNVVSLKKLVPFSEITTAQQKRLVKSIIDSSVYNLEFSSTMRDILRENCKDSSVNIDNLTIIDELVLALNLRIKSIGSDIDVEVTSKEQAPIKTTLNLNDILNVINSTVNHIDSVTLQDDLFSIECGVPSIGDVYRIYKTTDMSIDKLKTEQSARSSVGEMYATELIKYIKSVSVKKDDSILPVAWDTLSAADKIKVVELMRLPLLKQVIAYIENIQKEIEKIELVRFKFNGIEYTQRLTIDGNFFTIS